MIQQKITVIENTPNAFTVYDCTGTYSTSNKGGYGPPNYSADDITRSILYIQPPSATTSYPYQIDVTGDLPNPENLGFEVTPSEVGQNGKMESGQWKFKRETTFDTPDGPVTKTSYHTEILTKSVQCCIEEINVPLGTDAFKDERQRKAIELTALYTRLQFQIDKGLYDYANKTLEYLNSQCKCTGC